VPQALFAQLLEPVSPRISGSRDAIDVAESNHRIANSLALVAGMLRMQAAAVRREDRALRHDELAALLLEAAGHVDTIGRLHGRLSRGDTTFELDEIVREVAEATVESLAPPGQVQLVLQLEGNCGSPAQQTFPISLVVGELITNSLKHAHPAGVPGEIAVSCRQGPAGELMIEVTDDGVGLPEGIDPLTSDGFGFRLVRGLAKQLGAQLSFEDRGIGLMVRLRLPRSHPS